MVHDGSELSTAVGCPSDEVCICSDMHRAFETRNELKKQDKGDVSQKNSSCDEYNSEIRVPSVLSGYIGRSVRCELYRGADCICIKVWAHALCDGLQTDPPVAYRSEGSSMERRLTTIVAADIAGFSRLIGLDEEATLTAQRAHLSELVDPLLEKHGGRIANTAGDSLLIEFPSAVEAVRCCIVLQEGMAKRNAEIPDEHRILYRVGINVGDVVDRDGDLLGDGVNIAARLEALAPPGGIVVGRGVRDQVRDRLELNLIDLGKVEVKNISRPVHAFQVLREGEAALPLAEPAPQRRVWMIAAALLMVVLAGAGYWYIQRPEFRPADPAKMAYALTDEPAIAVLAFDNLTGDSEQEHVSDGLSEDIITALARMKGLLVMARNSSFAYKGKAVDVRQIAEELSVRYVMEGSLQSNGAQFFKIPIPKRWRNSRGLGHKHFADTLGVRQFLDCLSLAGMPEGDE